MSRTKYLDACDAGLKDKPHLSAVFNPTWRATFRANILALPPTADPGYPMAYWLPVMQEMHPKLYPSKVQKGMEAGLAVLSPQMTQRERDNLALRLKHTDTISACDELLATGAFVAKFGPQNIKWPTASPGQRRPEFFVEFEEARWAVECRQLKDNEQVRELNAAMIQTGQSWIEWIDPNRDPLRLRRAIVEKIKRQQGGGPVVIVLSSYTPWLMLDAMQTVVRGILLEPQTVGLAASDLPIALVCLTLTIVQGVWFCESACKAAGIDFGLQDRIGRTIMNGFVVRGDDRVLTGAAWHQT